MTTEVERTRPEAEASDDRTVEEEAVRQAAEAAAEEQDGPPAEIQEAAEAAEEAPAAELGPDEIVRVMESLLLATPAPLTIESARGATGLEKEPTNSCLSRGSSILSWGRFGPATLGTTDPRSSSMSCE